MNSAATLQTKKKLLNDGVIVLIDAQKKTKQIVKRFNVNLDLDNEAA